MEDKSRFSEDLINAINGSDIDGRSMVATSRLLLLVDYSDKEYDNDLFSVFNLIIDEHRDGATYNEIESLYKSSFIDSLLQFRKYFSL